MYLTYWNNFLYAIANTLEFVHDIVSVSVSDTGWDPPVNGMSLVKCGITNILMVNVRLPV